MGNVTHSPPTLAEKASPAKNSNVTHTASSNKGNDSKTEDKSATDQAKEPKASRPQDGENANGSQPEKRSKRRRKVNQACVYCQRSHMTCDQQRPCARCIKRSIGHLCHDEPREHKKTKIEHEDDGRDGKTSPSRETAGATVSTGAPTVGQTNHHPLDLPSASISAPITGDSVQIGQAPVETAPQGFGNINQPFTGFNEWGFGGQSQFADMHGLHPNYMFNTSEPSNEYNLLNDFLNNSLLDEAYYQGDNAQNLSVDPTSTSTMGASVPTSNDLFATTPYPNHVNLPQQSMPEPSSSSSKTTGNVAPEKAKEKYFLEAEDPTGSDVPEERMNKLLRAKYEAGMLKPFNYVNGYVRLQEWMSKKLRPDSREVIMKQFNKFRPKFRERIQKLDDLQLVMVEMWFEQKLMEYDRVFASMAIPACCWRRTGEISRGNREMAELIQVPLEQLRDGKLALHLILAEESLVKYWEKFGSVAFDTKQKAVLTRCCLKSPDSNTSDRPELQCCFSFTIVRDAHSVPGLIVGNFLPITEESSTP